MTAYTIRISEDQRAALLKLFDTGTGQELAGDGKPLECWPAMLEQLPQDEAEDPDCIHGFCL